LGIPAASWTPFSFIEQGGYIVRALRLITIACLLCMPLTACQPAAPVETADLVLLNGTI